MSGTSVGDVFVAIDGNGIGRVIEGCILAERFAELTAFSEQVTRIVQTLKHAIEIRGGEVYLAGGDNLLARMPRNGLEEVCRQVADSETARLHFAIGVGLDSRGAYLALKYAKTFSHRRVDYDGGFTCLD